MLMNSSEVRTTGFTRREAIHPAQEAAVRSGSPDTGWVCINFRVLVLRGHNFSCKIEKKILKAPLPKVMCASVRAGC